MAQVNKGSATANLAEAQSAPVLIAAPDKEGLQSSDAAGAGVDKRMPQKSITDGDMEVLIRAMVEAHRFLTIETPSAVGARFQNKMRVEHAAETLSIVLGPYQLAIEELEDRDMSAYREYVKEHGND